MIVQSEKSDIAARAQEKFKEFEEDETDPALAEFERHRREYINTMKRIRLENPDITPSELEMRAREEVMSKGPKSRAYYRLQATRKLAGKQDLSKKLRDKLAEEAAELEKGPADEKEVEEEKKDDGVMRLFFDPPHYTVMENIGSFEVTIVREGGDLNSTVQVDYKTEDGTACSDGDYTEAIGTLTFGPGVTEQKVTLSVEDDDVFEEDEHFYIRIHNPRRKDGIEISNIEVDGNLVPSIQLGTPHMATIMILDDDHGGVFQFAIPYTTEDGTAKAGKDYEHVEGELIYANEENS
jgi:solute carrier family 8 (sodium/calcium exchanger)